jgi:hypothetical protein
MYMKALTSVSVSAEPFHVCAARPVIVTQLTLARLQDVRENGEQEIGEEVDYWQSHTGDIGTGGGNTNTFDYH